MTGPTPVILTSDGYRVSVAAGHFFNQPAAERWT
jgi:hypothetical protein